MQSDESMINLVRLIKEDILYKLNNLEERIKVLEENKQGGTSSNIPEEVPQLVPTPEVIEPRDKKIVPEEEQVKPEILDYTDKKKSNIQEDYNLESESSKLGGVLSW